MAARPGRCWNGGGSQRELDIHAGQIGRHFRLSGRDADAAACFVLAGDHARLYANAEALTYYQAALALGHPEMSRLHVAVGDTHTLLGAYTAALGSYETLRRCANHQTRPWPRSSTSWGGSMLAAVSGQRPRRTLGRDGYSGATVERATTARIWSTGAWLPTRRGGPSRRPRWHLTHSRLLSQRANPLGTTQAHNILGILARARR